MQGALIVEQSLSPGISILLSAAPIWYSNTTQKPSNEMMYFRRKRTVCFPRSSRQAVPATGLFYRQLDVLE